MCVVQRAPGGLAHPWLERSVRAVLVLRTGNPERMRQTTMWLGCRGTGSVLGACAQAWPSNSTFHPCRPLLASRRRPCPHRSPPGPAHPPQLSTLCQMLAALKNVLARPDAPWSCRSSICPPASPVSPARQSQRPAPSSAAVQHTPSVDIASAHHHPLLTHPPAHPLAHPLAHSPATSMRNCAIVNSARRQPTPPSACRPVAPFNAHPPLTLVPALPIERAPSRVHSARFATHQTDWVSAELTGQRLAL